MTVIATVPGALGVTLLRWPQDADIRDQLAAFGQPRMLLVEPGVAPPVRADDLEDWLRTPPDPDDLQARADELRRRAGDGRPAQPVVDADGLLWVGRRWVALTPPQAPVVELLVAHLDRVVRYEALVAAYAAAGGSPHDASVRTMLARVAHRVRMVGLEVVTVRRRGVILTQPRR